MPAKKKVVKAGEACEMGCGCGGKACGCKAFMAAAIIVLLWVWGATATWSKVLITILAGLIFLNSLVGGWCKPKK